MPNIRIEWIPIQVMNLGLFGFDHMQLVYQQGVGDDFSDQENWLVLEGGFTINSQGQSELIVYGANGSLPLKWANGDDDTAPLTGQALIDEIGTPYSRGSRIVPTLDPFNAWQVMSSYGSEIHENQVPYVAHAIPGTAIPVINSSSVIASLLHSIDVDIRLVFPSGMRYSPGHTTLVGTSGDDELKIEDNFLTLVGGKGADEFFGKDSAFTQRYYGGLGNDVFHHSDGFKVFHGGDPFRPYDGDGLDTLDLTGINATIIKRNSEHIDHIFPHLIVQASGMNAWLLSIERFVWNDSTDKIFLQDGLQILDEQIYFNLKKESSLSGEDYGDTVDFTDIGGSVLINVLDDDTLIASRIENEQGRNGLRIEDAEYVIGSSQDDRIYITANMRGADGGNGNDIIDGRLGSAAAGTGPEGNPVELTGGSGDDTLVGASGESTLLGGAGADRFVLGALSSASGDMGPTEMVIADADADDRLFIPYNFLNNSDGAFDGSQLFPVLGGFGTYEDLVNDGETLFFQWRTQEQFIYEQNEPEGVIDFYGQIIYRMDGSDLLIQVLQAEPIDVFDPESSTVTATLLSFDFTTLSTIRVADFDRGDLGLVFHDLGEPDLQPIGPTGSATVYPNWNAAVQALTNGGQLYDPLPERPTPDPGDLNGGGGDGGGGGSGGGGRELLVGSSGDDDLTADEGDTELDGGDGNDNLVGNDGNDLLNGGSGDDTMQGGAGNDNYVVDSTLDIVIEQSASGIDTVIASVDYTLSAELENLSLADGAVFGTGNDLDNRLTGNAADNTLSGAEGSDMLFGDAGNDTLVGGLGNDRYVYVETMGNDRIVELDGEGDADSLTLGGILTPETVRFTRLASSPDDLLIELPDGHQLTIEGQFLGGTAGIEAIVFSDGTAWDDNTLTQHLASLGLTANSAPNAVDDAGYFLIGSSLTLPSAALLSNDNDLEDDTIAITAVTNPSAGTVSLDANGDVSIEVPEGFEDTLSFTYTITDSAGGTATAIAEVVIRPSNDTLSAADDTGFHVADTGTLEIAPGDLTANDTVIAPGDIAVQSVSAALNGSVAINAAGNIVFTPTPGYDGPASFEYTVTNAAGQTSTATVSLTVHAVTVLTGTGESDTINGTSGWDSITAGDGNDIINAMAGSDEIDGGLGSDDIFAGDGDDLVNAGAGNDEVRAGSGNDIVFGGDNGDDLWGDDGNDIMDGQSGNDILHGGLGLDILYGGNGSDQIYGEDDADLVYGGDGADIISGGSGWDTLYGGSASDTINGNAGNDEIHGENSADILFGDDGDDLIFGGDADDTIDGGTGNDRLFGEAGSDLIEGGDGNDEINGGGGYDILSGGAGDDILAGEAGNDQLSGGAGNDQLTSGSGTDILDGGDGDDILTAVSGWNTMIGGSGNDLLIGGADRETFVFALNSGFDTIENFVTASSGTTPSDRIDLMDYGIADFAGVMAIASQSGSDTVLSLSNDAVVTLVGIDLTTLTGDDFLL